MLQLALLRGINVGGKSKVAMTALRESFTEAGCENVETYIASGNVIFDGPGDGALGDRLEQRLETDFGFPIRVLLRDAASVRAVAEALPTDWVNDRATKCDVLFLWHDVDGPDALSQFTIRPGVDHVTYVPGAVVWRVDRRNQSRSGLLSIVGTDLYRKVTIRNVNTVRKLAALMAAREA